MWSAAWLRQGTARATSSFYILSDTREVLLDVEASRQEVVPGPDPKLYSWLIRAVKGSAQLVFPQAGPRHGLGASTGQGLFPTDSLRGFPCLDGEG